MADSRKCAQPVYLTEHDAQVVVYRVRIGSVALAISQGRDMADQRHLQFITKQRERPTSADWPTPPHIGPITCVIWVESEEDCRALFETTWKLIF
jgi:hypothetical protein